MRWSAATSVALVAALSLPAAAAPPAAGLGARIAGLVGRFSGGAAVWVSDPALAAPAYAHDADREVIAASLYKLALMAAVEEKVERRELRYGDTIVIEPDDITADGSFEPVGTEMTIDDALEAMITLSDNGTAVHFWRTLGGSAVNTFLGRQGITGFHIATSVDDDHTTTARAVGTYFRKLARGELVSRSASERMLARLERQRINDRIPAQLPEGTRVAHKTGNLAGLVHDAGIVYAPSTRRVIVAMTWDADDATASELIASLAAAVYGDAVASPASARYRVPQVAQYAQHNEPFAMETDVENTGEDPWIAGSIRLVWELRDATGAAVLRVPRPIDLGTVAAGGSVTVPIAFRAPPRPGEHKLQIGLMDAAGRALGPLGVATATVPIRVHLPVVAQTEVRIPALLHRREASLVEVTYRAFDRVRLEDHSLTLAWRFIDPATDRVVAQGRQALGIIKTYEETGTFFAPLAAPNVRGTYRLEYEIVERGFLAGTAHETTVEILSPRTFGDTAGPTSQQRRLLEQQQPRPTATPTPRPAITPVIPSSPPRPAPRPSAFP